MITIAQRLKYFPLEHRAWMAHCAQNGLDEVNGVAEMDWRHEEQLNEVGKGSLTDFNKTSDYDIMMLHWAIICGDETEIAYWSVANERRMQYLVRRAMEQIARLEHQVVTWKYVLGLETKMNIPTDFNECPAELLFKVYQALDTHVRRLRRRHDEAHKTHAA